MSSALAQPAGDFPIVLRLQSLFPHALVGYRMHAERRGGDLSHVDAERSGMNRSLIGAPDWVEEALAEVEIMRHENLQEARIRGALAHGSAKRLLQVMTKGVQRLARKARTDAEARLAADRAEVQRQSEAAEAARRKAEADSREGLALAAQARWLIERVRHLLTPQQAAEVAQDKSSLAAAEKAAIARLPRRRIPGDDER